MPRAIAITVDAVEEHDLTRTSFPRHRGPLRAPRGHHPRFVRGGRDRGADRSHPEALRPFPAGVTEIIGEADGTTHFGHRRWTIG